MEPKLSRFHSALEKILPGPIFRGLRSIEWFLITIVLQKVLGALALFLIYFFVLGPTSILARTFFARALHSRTISRDSNWVRAEGYSEDIDGAKFQS
jgi:hypothetical protein